MLINDIEFVADHMVAAGTDGIDFDTTGAAGDAVAVLIGFTDAECNLACGSRYYSFSTPDQGEGDAGSIQSNLPCDTASSSVYLGFDLGVVMSGDYNYSLMVEDACGGSSARVEDGFTVP